MLQIEALSQSKGKDKTEQKLLSEKYNTPQFKQIHWDSDEDPALGEKSVTYFRTNRMRKIMFHWIKLTNQN